MYFAKTPDIIKPFASQLIWDVDTAKKEIYFTFDDGPTPGVTEKVLEILASYDAKATFFCVGNNVVKYPELFRKLTDEGHSVGNHTQNHLNGWQSSNFSYFKDYLACAEVVRSDLFRPPYGRIKRFQAETILTRSKVIMWDVLSGDFDQRIDAEKCTTNVLNHVKEGSIVVYHDSVKAKENVLNSLPKVLENLAMRGFTFSNLDSVLKD